MTLLERHNGLVHAAVYALPEDSPETLTLAPLAPPALLELKQAVAAPDPAGSVFGAEGGGPVLEGPGGTLKPAKSLESGAEAEEEAYSLALGKQGPWQSDIVRLVYSSLVTPESTYDVDVRTGGASGFYSSVFGASPSKAQSWSPHTMSTCAQVGGAKDMSLFAFNAVALHARCMHCQGSPLMRALLVRTQAELSMHNNQ